MIGLWALDSVEIKLKRIEVRRGGGRRAQAKDEDAPTAILARRLVPNPPRALIFSAATWPE